MSNVLKDTSAMYSTSITNLTTARNYSNFVVMLKQQAKSFSVLYSVNSRVLTMLCK